MGENAGSEGATTSEGAAAGWAKKGSGTPGAGASSVGMLEALGTTVAIMARLRAPGGCAWDREQTFESIQRHTLEETYEVFDAIDRRAWGELKDELGDLLLQVLFYAQMAAEAGYFDIADVAAGLNAKLIRRHPHVFGDAVASDSGAVLRHWEVIKEHERAGRRPAGDGGKESLLDAIPRSMPAMLEAGKLGSRAARVGFDWPEVDGVFAKLEEEIVELREAVSTEVNSGSVAPAAVREEVGDLLFTAVHLARHLKVDPETALRNANGKFRARFRHMEAAAGGTEALAGHSAEQQERLWEAAKGADGLNSVARRDEGAGRVDPSE